MTTEACESCGRPSPSAFLCQECTSRLRNWLRDLVDHAYDLDHVYTGAVSPRGERVMVRGKGETPLVFNEDASEVKWTLGNTLTAIAHDLLESRGVDFDRYHRYELAGLIGPVRDGWRRARPSDYETPAIAHFLWECTESVALAPGAGETYEMVRYLAATGEQERDQRPAGIVVKAVDIYPPKRLLGPCDGTVEGELCGADLRARDDDEEIDCGLCGATYNVVMVKLRVLREMSDKLATATEIAEWVAGSIKVATIWQWGSRGRIVKKGISREGDPLYRIGDVIDRWDMMRRRERETRLSA